MRAPIAEATERPSASFPLAPLDTLPAKFGVAPLLVRLIASEYVALRGRGFDVIYVHDEPALYVYGVVGRAIGARVVRHVHMGSGGSLEGFRRRLAHFSIYVSRHAGGVDERTLIRNPLPKIDVRRAPVRGQIVVAGSICRRKNQMLAVETLAYLLSRGFDGDLRLCGSVIEPDYAAAVHARAEQLGCIDRVRFEGSVPPQDYLATASVLLMPSTYENQPLALLEAVYAGVPVVASDIAAHRELAELNCLDPARIRPLTPADFAQPVLEPKPVSEELARQVGAVFAETRFKRELNDFFNRI